MPLRASAGISSAARTAGVWWPLSPRNRALIRPSAALAGIGSGETREKTARNAAAHHPAARGIALEDDTMGLLNSGDGASPATGQEARGSGTKQRASYPPLSAV